MEIKKEEIEQPENLEILTDEILIEKEGSFKIHLRSCKFDVFQLSDLGIALRDRILGEKKNGGSPNYTG